MPREFEDLWICGCKLNKVSSGPYCDDSHVKIDFDHLYEKYEVGFNDDIKNPDFNYKEPFKAKMPKMPESHFLKVQKSKYTRFSSIQEPCEFSKDLQ